MYTEHKTCTNDSKGIKSSPASVPTSRQLVVKNIVVLDHVPRRQLPHLLTRRLRNRRRKLSGIDVELSKCGSQVLPARRLLEEWRVGRRSPNRLLGALGGTLALELAFQRVELGAEAGVFVFEVAEARGGCLGHVLVDCARSQ